MGDGDVLTPLINSQEPSCSQGLLTADTSNAWGRLYPENKSLKIEGFSFSYKLISNSCIA